MFTARYELKLQKQFRLILVFNMKPSSHYIPIDSFMMMGIMHFEKGTRNIVESSTVGFLQAITVVVNTANFQKGNSLIVSKRLLEYTIHLNKTACESRKSIHLYI